jgi:hypothetical protein
MSERVSDERLAAALESTGQVQDSLLVHGARHVALDLRDARAERDALRDQVRALEVLLESSQGALSDVIREHREAEEAHVRVAAENLSDMRALVEAAVRAGWDNIGDGVALTPDWLNRIADRVLREQGERT